MAKKLFLLILLCMYINACKNNRNAFNVSQAQLEKSIDILSDSSFFSDIRCMQYHQDKIYALDVQRREIIITNEMFNETSVIGTGGAGPEELHTPVKFYCQNDTTYVLDFGSMRIKEFEKDIFKKSIRIPKFSEKRFTTTEFLFYIPLVTDTSSIFILNKLNNDTYFGGDITEFSTGKETYIRNDRDLLKHGNYLYTVSDNIPVITKYELGTLYKISDYDFSDVPLIKSNLKIISEKKKNINSYYILTKDSYIANNRLYLLCTEFKGIYSSNHILVFNLDPEIEFHKIYKLPGKIYESFCVSDSYIYAFNDHLKTLEKIKLNE